MFWSGGMGLYSLTDEVLRLGNLWPRSVYSESNSKKKGQETNTEGTDGIYISRMQEHKTATTRLRWSSREESLMINATPCRGTSVAIWPRMNGLEEQAGWVAIKLLGKWLQQGWRTESWASGVFCSCWRFTRRKNSLEALLRLKMEWDSGGGDCQNRAECDTHKTEAGIWTLELVDTTGRQSAEMIFITSELCSAENF